mmetsp:Transcript_4832/g.15586  ORF Transcript_4832/g.15586 Transcript_4832/m.15586 type:complete len:250 (+) Transcript_4832:82-831(+)
MHGCVRACTRASGSARSRERASEQASKRVRMRAPAGRQPHSTAHVDALDLLHLAECTTTPPDLAVIGAGHLPGSTRVARDLPSIEAGAPECLNVLLDVVEEIHVLVCNLELLLLVPPLNHGPHRVLLPAVAGLHHEGADNLRLRLELDVLPEVRPGARRAAHVLEERLALVGVRATGDACGDDSVVTLPAESAAQRLRELRDHQGAPAVGLVLNAAELLVLRALVLPALLPGECPVYIEDAEALLKDRL